MKRIVIICLLGLGLQAKAQAPAEAMAIDKIKPLNELIDLAIAYAPAIDALSTSQDQRREEMSITKKKWMQHIALSAGVNYGNGIVSDQLTNGVGTDNRVTYLSRQNVTYNVGLNIRLPFSEASSRKHEIKLKKLEIERLEYLKQDQQNTVKEEVIKRYKSLMICLKSVELQTEVVETNNMALKVAENYFNAAKLPVEQYRTMLDKTYTARLELEKVKNEAWFCLKSLNALVGQSILK